MKQPAMDVAWYHCSHCERGSRFKGLPTVFDRWLLTCRKCGRYTLHRLFYVEPAA